MKGQGREGVQGNVAWQLEGQTRLETAEVEELRASVAGPSESPKQCEGLAGRSSGAGECLHEYAGQLFASRYPAPAHLS